MTLNEKAEHISLAEVKQILTKVEKERKELLYEQRIALEHANKFAKISITKNNQLIKDLEKIDRIDIHYAHKIADLLPKTEEDIKTIFAKERITLKDNDIKEILKLINKYYIE